MKLITGDMWTHTQDFDLICVTTNGTIRKNGAGVMGRGNAFEATKRFPQLEAQLGKHLRENGNHVGFIGIKLLAFPTKNEWHQKSDLDLIQRSCRELMEIVKRENCTVLLPRPGVGNGKLDWNGQVLPLLEQELKDDRIYVIGFPTSPEENNGSIRYSKVQAA